jgi:hypothetical protein
MRIPKVRWSACPLGVRYSKSGAGVVVTGLMSYKSPGSFGVLGKDRALSAQRAHGAPQKVC